MSFDFNNNINPINKTQATYKDGGGLGGGGMYMRQQKKKQEFQLQFQKKMTISQAIMNMHKK